MPRRSLGYRKLQALEDERKLEQLSTLSKLRNYGWPDATGQIPATIPEKMVYNYLLKLGVRFAFQYHEVELESTAFPEEVYIPDFTIPDYNSRIQVFGTYWHSLPNRRESDLRQIVRNLYAGRQTIEHGVPLLPEGGGYTGKYIIWWENEIYNDLGFLFSRDFPELLSRDRIKGEPEENILDFETQRKRLRAMRARMSAARMKPKVEPMKRQLRSLRRRVTDLTKIHPYLKVREKDIKSIRLPRTKRKTRPKQYMTLKRSLEKYA